MKRVLITDACGGIGLATSKLLLDKRHQLRLVARTGSKLKDSINHLKG